MLTEHVSTSRTDRVISPFAMVAARLAEQGYTPLPIMPGGKAPGSYSVSGWRPMQGWSEYCDRAPTPDEIGAWERWPSAGVGIALGRGVIAVDIDRDDLIEPIKAALPAHSIAKRGKKGLTLFFRGDTTKIRSRAFKIDGSTVLDLLARGKQTVVPPSIHPETGVPYVDEGFFGLTDTPVDELPELPDNVEELIADALRPFGYEAEPIVERCKIVRQASADSETPFRALNDEALANLDAWVPELGLPRCKRQGAVWRAVAPWTLSGRGVSDNRREPTLSFDPKGIRDYGDGDRPYTPLNVVKEAMGLDLNEAFKWLGEALGHSFEPAINLVAGPSSPSERAKREAAEAEQEDEAEPAPEPAPTRAELEALCHPPGLVGELMDWIDGSARQPCRALALGPALTFMAALAGRHNEGPTSLRPNLYTVALAKSGFGKDHARKCIDRLATTAGLDRFIGPEDFPSDSGLRDAVDQKPSSVCLVDEFGGLIAKIMDRKAGQHLAGVRHMLLKLYTSSDGTYRGAAYAQRSATPIFNPCLSIYGTTTPHDFWPSLSSKGVGDGFLPRFLVLNIEGDPLKAIEPVGSRQPPAGVVERCRALSTPHGGDLAGLNGPVEALKAQWGVGAKAVYDHAVEECMRRAAGKSESDVLWTRTMEQALKLAHIVALGVNPTRPVVTKEHMCWGVDLAVLSTRIFVSELNDRLANNDRQAEYLQVKRMIRAAGANGTTAREIGRKLNGALDKKRRDDILQQLVADGYVRKSEVKPAGGGRPSERYVIR